MAVSVIDSVLTTISRYNMLGSGSRVIPAVSGGADSVFLLTALCEIGPRIGATVAGVAHLNHKLRGAESDQDERFVATLAARLNLPFYRAEVHLGKSGGNLEQAARRARLRFFEALLRDGKADRIATGHTRDDQAETVLFRMLRGSGLAGLSGILPVTQSGLIRPLLESSRAEIERFLRGGCIEWREDSSNDDPRFARNRIRHTLLPQLERDWNPELRQTLARMADVAGEEEGWWRRRISKLARENWVEADGGIEYPANVLARLPKAVGRRLVRFLAHAGGGSNDFGPTEKILDLAAAQRGSGRLELPRLTVTRSFNWLRFQAPGPIPEPQPIRLKVSPGFHVRIPWHGSTIWLQSGDRDLNSPDALTGKPQASACVRLKWRGPSALLELRGWQAGDHYRPVGASRDQKLKEMFQSARIPSWKREFWPIVTDGSKILWAKQFGPAAGSHIERGSESCLWIWETSQDALLSPAKTENGLKVETGLEAGIGRAERRRAMNHLPSIQRL